jgi:hypothetical protein
MCDVADAISCQSISMILSFATEMPDMEKDLGWLKMFNFYSSSTLSVAHLFLV